MKLKKYLFLFVILCGVIFASVYVLGNILTSPHQTNFDLKPEDLSTEDIIFSSKTGKLLSGWFVKGEQGKGGILLMHSVRSDRREMIGRARMLNKAGYSVLLFDFQAHGKSHGEHITFGYLESQDAEAAFELLKNRLPDEPTGVIGVSLGGASALFSSIKKQADAMIIEMVYPTLEEAVNNRILIRLGSLGRYLSPLLLKQIKPRLGFDPDKLSPINELKNTTSPIFIIAGSDDKHTSLAESERMFNNAPEPKQKWIVEGAAHQNLFEYDQEQYRDKVLGFFKEYLKNE